MVCITRLRGELLYRPQLDIFQSQALTSGTREQFNLWLGGWVVGWLVGWLVGRMAGW